MRAVQITQFGGPEVLQVVDVPPPAGSDPLVLIEVAGAGVNYADTHQIEDSYLAPQRLPLIPGNEVVGTVRRGSGSGHRVVALTRGGGYAEQAVAHPSTVFTLPEDISDPIALALVLQGTTAWHLLRTCGRLATGETVVVQAGAGGVGSLAVQLARQWGAGRVIATASSPAKRDLALSLGADVAVDVSTAEDADQVQAILQDAAGDRRIDLVLEMTGGPVLDGSLQALGPWGRLVVYGSASRQPATPIPPRSLISTTRSVSGFWLRHALDLPGGLAPAMEELFSLVRAGRLTPVIGGHYPLEQAALAHQDLRARRSTGKLVLDLR